MPLRATTPTDAGPALEWCHVALHRSSAGARPWIPVARRHQTSGPPTPAMCRTPTGAKPNRCWCRELKFPVVALVRGERLANPRSLGVWRWEARNQRSSSHLELVFVTRASAGGVPRHAGADTAARRRRSSSVSEDPLGDYASGVPGAQLRRLHLRGRHRPGAVRPRAGRNGALLVRRYRRRRDG